MDQLADATDHSCHDLEANVERGLYSLQRKPTSFPTGDEKVGRPSSMMRLKLALHTSTTAPSRNSPVSMGPKPNTQLSSHNETLTPPPTTREDRSPAAEPLIELKSLPLEPGRRPRSGNDAGQILSTVNSIKRLPVRGIPSGVKGNSPPSYSRSVPSLRPKDNDKITFRVKDNGSIVFTDGNSSSRSSSSIGLPLPPPSPPSSGGSSFIHHYDYHTRSISPVNRIILEVGGREFQVYHNVFDESALLKDAILSATVSHDGTRRIRIENDPDHFKDVLQYLRTKTYPLFWEQSRGFDFSRYAILARQAIMYQIPRLYDWIAEEKYLDAVKVTVTTEETKAHKGSDFYEVRSGYSANRDRKVDAVVDGVAQVWMCPRGVESHDNESAGCDLAGCCGNILETSSKDHPENRVDVAMSRVFVTERVYTLHLDALLI